MILLLMLPGCRLDITTTAEIAADGTGSVIVAMSMDEALVSALDEAQVDPTAALAAAVLLSDWRLDRRVAADGSIVVTLDRAVTSPDELTAALRSLSEGLDEHAPALIVDLVIDGNAKIDGGVQVRGTAQVRPPDDVGMLIDGVPQGPSTEVLAALAAEMIDARLRLSLPGEVIEHDGDRHDGAVVEWQLPVGVERTITMATSPAARSWWPSGFTGGLMAGITVLVFGSVALAVWRWRRARTLEVTPSV